jgi:transcriptional regulator with XRE-family HTH domain
VESKFSEFFHEKRIATGLTLRQFCLRHGLDPGNLSKLERGILPPPESREKLEHYAKLLQLAPGSADRQDFFDLAAAERGRIPDELMEDEDLVRKLPAFFRTLRGARVDGKLLDDLVEAIRNNNRA